MSGNASAMFIFLAFTAIAWVGGSNQPPTPVYRAESNEQTRRLAAALIEHLISGCATRLVAEGSAERVSQ